MKVHRVLNLMYKWNGSIELNFVLGKLWYSFKVLENPSEHVHVFPHQLFDLIHFVFMNTCIHFDVL